MKSRRESAGQTVKPGNATKKAGWSARLSPSSRKPVHAIPPILLEGDEPSTFPPHNGQEAGPAPAPPPGAPAREELPQAYGTGQLSVTSRDPHWLYVHWDLAPAQQRQYNRLARDQHLIVRVHAEDSPGQPLSETHVHPESQHWFVHARRAGTRYHAELGYYRADHQWVALAASRPVATPPDAPSEDQSVQLATIPPEVPLPQLVLPAKPVLSPAPPAKASSFPEPQPVRISPSLRFLEHLTPGRQIPAGTLGVAQPHLVERPLRLVRSDWTPAQRRAFAQTLRAFEFRTHWANSETITQIIPRELEAAVPCAPGLPAETVSLPSPVEIQPVSSPMGGEQPERQGFWFNVNADLVLYGSTEPNALVTIAGRPIHLRPDGSFSFRFTLPDGTYALLVAATSQQGEVRLANLHFHRDTTLLGEVGVQPPGPGLNPPPPDNPS